MDQGDIAIPLVPADVDLRGYGWMPFYGNHLLGSEYNAKCNDAEWRAGVTLWWAAWNQVPAASLPDDDIALARMAQLGKDVRGWKKLRPAALHGFIKCTDGRLYHPFLAKLALEAWDKRVRERKRKADWRARQNGDGTGTLPGLERGQDGDVPSKEAGTEQRKRDDRTGQENKNKNIKINGHPVEFETAWQAYPKRAGGNPKRDAEQAWNARVKAGADPVKMLDGIQRYAEFCKATGRVGTEYVLQARTFFGPAERYNDDWTPPAPKPTTTNASGRRTFADYRK